MNVTCLSSLLMVVLVLVFSIKKLWNSSLISSRRLCKALFFAVIVSLSQLFIINSSDETVSLVSYAFYFSSLGWMLYNLVYFCQDFTGRKKCPVIQMNILAVLLVIDTLLCFTNCIWQFYYSVYPAGLMNRIVYQFDKTPFFIYHLFLNYAIFFHCAFVLIVSTVLSPALYRLKYVFVVGFVCLIFTANFFYLFEFIRIDVSVFLYPFISLFFYYGTVKTIPLKLIRRTLALLVDNMDNGLILFDIDGKCVYINSMVKKTFRTSRDRIFDIRPLCDWIDKDDFSMLENYSEYFDHVADNKKQNFKIFFNRITDNKKRFIGSYYIIQNITEETVKLIAEHKRATRDKLTGLYNRDYFCEKVEHRLRFDKSTGYYIIVSDIVNFKLINDLFGTGFGDIVLKRIAEELEKLTDDQDIYGRLHNDHFVLLMPKKRFNENVFIEAFKETFGYLNNFSYSLVCHIGVYEVDDRSIPVSVMCDRAFLALHTIKSDFNTTTVFYDSSLRNEVMKMQELMNELPMALKNNELVMYLQPQMTAEEKLLGAEALVRWHHHDQGIIAPSDFIQVIEKIGMISEVDKYVWEEACKKLAQWKAEGKNDLYISINLSPKDFYSVNIYEHLTSLVEKYGVSPANLNLEITETAIIMDLDRQIKLIERLRAYGFAVEMDDFGSGYSSLNMLKDIDVDVLKIDMAFLKESQDDEKSRKILEKIIILAKELGMKVVTEGVEKREQVDFLKKFGCDIFQGYYFSKPVTVQEFEEKYLKG